MYGMGLGYALNCVLRMLEIFSRGRESEVEGDDSHGSAHGMHSIKVEAHRHYTSISPKAELKVHVFLNVGH